MAQWYSVSGRSFVAPRLDGKSFFVFGLQLYLAETYREYLTKTFSLVFISFGKKMQKVNNPKVPGTRPIKIRLCLYSRFKYLAVLQYTSI